MTEPHPNIDKARAVLVLAATIGTLVFNWLAAQGWVNGATPAEISARFPTEITPAGYAFSIWTLIYAGLLAFSLYQLFSRPGIWIREVRSFYILSCALNCAWIFVWNSGQIAVAFGIIVALLAVLVVINVKARRSRSALESLFARVPFELYLGWVAIAACANFAVLLASYGIDVNAGSHFFGTTMVLLAAAFGVFFRVRLTSYFVPLAIAWGLTGIAVEQSGKTLIVAAAAVGVVACLIASCSAVLDLKSSRDE
ncbi:MAG: TspO/MBR family protein [Pyrinomonadaceae bacterium]